MHTVLSVSSRVGQKKRWRFVGLFLLLFIALELVYYWSRDGLVERVLIDYVTVMPSAMLINIIEPLESVHAQGHRLISKTVRLSVLNGCEGTEAMLLLLAAILSFSANWKYKLIGIVCGIALVYFVNLGRIVGLYFALRHDQFLFDIIHGYIGPTLIILIAGLFFLGWTNVSQRHETA